MFCVSHVSIFHEDLLNETVSSPGTLANTLMFSVNTAQLCAIAVAAIIRSCAPIILSCLDKTKKIGDAAQTVADPQASLGEKAVAVGMFAAGVVGPGGGGSTTLRLRHFTNSKGVKGIMESGVIKASDQNSVFSVAARGKAGGPRDVEKALGIKRGRGNNYIEFDVKSSEIKTVRSSRTGTTEKVFKGDVNLKDRNAKEL